MTNEFHEANRRHWDARSAEWARSTDERGVWRRCAHEPELVLCDLELAYLGDLAGRRVCVLGSGDNEAVFALAGMGALVTSVDLSQNQLDVAANRAAELGLAVDFVCADVTDLSALGSALFDFVYTGGHVAVWVSDLHAYYAEAARILRPGGCLVVREYHPFRRVWGAFPDRLTIAYPYFSRGPFEYCDTLDPDHPEDAPLRSYEYHWTVAEFLTAILRSGLHLVDAHEFGNEVDDWEAAPLEGLPEYLLLVGRKPA